MKAYLRSKTANLMWTYELARRLEGTGITVNAVNPGDADTQLQQESLSAAPLPMRVIGIVMTPLMRLLMDVSPESAAYSSVHAATSNELTGMTGLYLDTKGKPDSSSSISRDEGLAADLWEIAANRVGVDLYGEPSETMTGDVVT
ncbi:SDR family NAD(P)-dependent oxidoreductase [Salinirubellus salinus]|uniref:SDR family NAD(P)-dependent oxidoreductase n=1 Tax=Salinirubellus salinus TaxID=1364945 RepID=A0A9E7UA34_9EURY|nr:SDR family NAD(P)-dependent oxidoreductase [Salinirubellus salinus]UWM53449.1 SDR family NAD(P)-dependent oxidoreductase [Salinirubellus salinus]